MRFRIAITLLFAFIYLPYIIGKKSKENARILIIGAGPSGIAAATKLFENGFKNIIILEAENRMGGRTFTTKFGDYNVDLGAQYVVGVEGNVAYELAKPLGLLDEANETFSGVAGIFFDSQGNLVNEEIANDLFNISTYLYEAEFKDTSFKSVGENAEYLFDERFKDNPSIMDKKQNYLFFLEQMNNGEWATDTWNELSDLSQVEYRNYPGDNTIIWKNLGYFAIIDILLKRYPDPKKELAVKNNVLFNSEVTSIDYSQDSDVLITTVKGETYKADHVIVTVSLGHLKEKHDTLFKPKLPANKVDTIEAIGYGNLAKIFLLFDKPFWFLGNKRVIYFAFVWNDADKEIVEADLEKEWLLGIANGNTVPFKPNLLELWVAGKYNKLMENLPEDKVLNHTMENLHRFLGKNYSIPEPIGMMRTQWFSNPHFRGTYSYRSVETDKRNVSRATLEEPLSHNNLTVMFAGEATSSDRYGTVDGAILTGWKAANRLMELYGRSSITSK